MGPTEITLSTENTELSSELIHGISVMLLLTLIMDRRNKVTYQNKVESFQCSCGQALKLHRHCKGRIMLLRFHQDGRRECLLRRGTPSQSTSESPACTSWFFWPSVGMSDSLRIPLGCDWSANNIISERHHFRNLTFPVSFPICSYSVKQLAHCPNKRQQTPTNANKLQQLGQCVPIVCVCWSLSGTVGRVQHVQSGLVKLQNVWPM